MFIFLFGDDIDFDTGIVDDKIVVFDEQDLRGKVRIVLAQIVLAQVFILCLSHLLLFVIPCSWKGSKG